MSSIGNDGQNSVPIYSYVSLMTLEIILKCAFSYEVEIQNQRYMSLNDALIQTCIHIKLANRFLCFRKSDPYVTAVVAIADIILHRIL